MVEITFESPVQMSRDIFERKTEAALAAKAKTLEEMRAIGDPVLKWSDKNGNDIYIEGEMPDDSVFPLKVKLVWLHKEIRAYLLFENTHC